MLTEKNRDLKYNKNLSMNLKNKKILKQMVK